MTADMRDEPALGRTVLRGEEVRRRLMASRPEHDLRRVGPRCTVTDRERIAASDELLLARDVRLSGCGRAPSRSSFVVSRRIIAEAGAEVGVSRGGRRAL
jgi:hypothetical protein